MERNSPNMRTHDLGLAAALLSYGFGLRATNRDLNGRVYFAFLRTGELMQAIDAYWADTLTIKARTYFDNTKMLKARIYADE